MIENRLYFGSGFTEFVFEKDFESLDPVPVRFGCSGLCGCTGRCEKIREYISKESLKKIFSAKKIYLEAKKEYDELVLQLRMR